MNLIVLMRAAGKTRHLDLAKPWLIAAFAAACLLLLGSVFWAGLSIGAASGARQALANPADTVRAQLQDRIDALALRIGSLDAQLLRINALGKRLAEMANIRSSEFDFDRDPPQGGDASEAGRGVSLGELGSSMARVEGLLDFRNAQLSVLERVLLRRKLTDEIVPSGKPVSEGYVSSGFGERMDPFNGEEAFHKGIDFAAPAGSDVLAVAAGIVTAAGPREGFGILVEVEHGDGFVTRYAHSSQALVRPGEVVQRGQRLAVVGSTGRSTGPHVHFEVLKNDKAVNPASFIGH